MYTKQNDPPQHILLLFFFITFFFLRFRSIAMSYFRRVDGVLLLYDVTYERSFLNVRNWLDSIEVKHSSFFFQNIYCSISVFVHNYIFFPSMFQINTSMLHTIIKCIFSYEYFVWLNIWYLISTYIIVVNHILIFTGRHIW